MGVAAVGALQSFKSPQAGDGGHSDTGSTVVTRARWHSSRFWVCSAAAKESFAGGFPTIGLNSTRYRYSLDKKYAESAGWALRDAMWAIPNGRKRRCRNKIYRTTIQGVSEASARRQKKDIHFGRNAGVLPRDCQGAEEGGERDRIWERYQHPPALELDCFLLSVLDLGLCSPVRRT